VEDTGAGAGALYAANCITRDNDIRQGEREATRDTYVRSTPHSAAVSRRFLAWLMASHGARPTARHAARTCTAPSARCAPCAPAPVISRHLAHRYLCVCQMCVSWRCVCVKCTGSVHRGSLSLCRVCRVVLTIINRYGVRKINTLRGARATAGSRGTHTTHVTRTCATQCHTDALRVRLVTCTHPASGRLPAPGSAGPRAGCARGARGSRAPLG
jgi:hypothetical protein